MTHATDEAGISVSLGFLVDLGHKLDEERAWRKKHADIVFQMPVIGQIPLVAGAGTLDTGQPQMGPPREHCWSIRWLNVSGFSAGTVTVFINAIEQYYQVTPTVNTWNKMGRGELLLQPGDRITLAATGITGAVQMFGRADAFPYWYQRTYLD